MISLNPQRLKAYPLAHGGQTMPGIKKLPSGRWQGRYFAGLDEKGKRIYPSKSFLVRADAVRWRRDRIHEKESGQPADSLELTVGSYLDRWLEMMKQRTRPATLHNFTTVCRLYIRPTFSQERLRHVSPIAIQSWQELLLKKLSARSVCDVRTIFSMSLKKAVSLKLIASNPIADTDPPKFERKEMKTFTPEQARTFLSYCDLDRWGLLFTTMLMTGIRPGEAQGLCWSAVDLAQGRIRVEKTIVTRGVEKWEFQPPKTQRSRREIAMPASLITRLTEYRRGQLEERMAAGAAYENHDLVFANAGGGPLLIHALHLHFKEVLRRAELPDIRLYDLRHSFATLSIVAEIDLKTVSSDMGHASVAFTLDHYGHVLESMRKGAAQRREEMFGNRGAVGRK